MQTLVLDNYDSFTYNLVHYLEELGANVHVFRNDEIGVDEVASFDQVVFSPGPSLPKDAGIMNAVITEYITTKKMLGVCLGMQAIAEYYGGVLDNMDRVKHGTKTLLQLTEAGEKDVFFKGVESKEVGLYHSWAIQKENMPQELEVTAIANNVVMACKHNQLPVWGVQYHPESILTASGKQMLKNWLLA